VEWGTFLASGECVNWKSRLDRVNWRTRETKQLLKSEGRDPIGGVPSPGGSWVAYENSGHLYVIRVP
jgi:hypothetical protein